ncbi:MAG: type I methionyl aminopeptidase [Candidatus Calescibacterium sp.]|nr:type I methionyl aminopeptidase [Candidatus Calescibacterium sp.]MCX7972489.1 type I methionyl aminopeptidase [bacterium]MDW8195619.1 type I methionyl aminopeptidase [Candidatus Calescibacterium sp.]
MIIKNNHQLEKIKIAGAINNFTLQILKDLTLKNSDKICAQDLDELAYRIISTLGGKPSFKNYKPPFSSNPYPYSITVSINEEIVHGLPTKDKRFKPGDVVSIDCGTSYGGFHVDSAISFTIGQENRKIVEVCRESLYLAIEKIKHGVYIRDIGGQIENFVKKNGFYVIKQLTGHGVGRTIHDDPEVPNYYIPSYSKKFYNGMLVAIEPMISEGSEEIEVLEDNWTIVTKDRSISAHFEHTIVVKHKESEILTIIQEDLFRYFFDKVKEIIYIFEKNLERSFS